MNFEELKAHAYHSLMLYSIAADAPRLLYIPDMLNAAIDGDMDTLKNDFETFMLDSLADLPEFLLYKVNGEDIEEWKQNIREKVKNVNQVDIIERKNNLIDIINEIIDQGNLSIPALRKLK